MIIQNKKTQLTYELTKAEWEKIKSMKLHTLYSIVSTEDSIPKVTDINVPIRIKELQESLRIKREEQTVKLPEPKTKTKRKPHAKHG